MSPRAQGIAAAAGLIAVVTILARAAGFVRTLVFADSVRAAGVGEVYNAVNAVPNVLYEVAAGGALAAVAVPLVAGHLGAGRAEEASRVSSALLTWSLSVLVPLSVVVWVLAGPIASVLVGDGVAGGAETGASMLRVFAWQIPLYGVGVVLAGVLQAHRRFLAAAVAPLLSSLVVIVSYLFYGSIAEGRTTGVGDQAIAVLAWGTTLGVVVLSLPLLGPAVATGWRPRWTWRFPEGEARRAWTLAGAGLLALTAQQLAVLVTIRISLERGGGQGTLSVQNWIQAVYLLPYAVLAVPLATAAFPALAAGNAETDRPDAPEGEAWEVARSAEERVAATLSRTMRTLVVLVGVGAAALIAAAPQIGAFFGHLDARRGGGTVSGAAVEHLGEGLLAFAVGLPAFAAVALLTRALYVRGHALAGGAALAAGWGISAVGPLLTIRAGSTPQDVLVGLGTWWSAGMVVAALAQWLLVVRAWGGHALREAVPAVVASGLGVGVVALLSWGLRGSVPVGDSILATLGIGVLAGLVGAVAQLGLVLVGHRRGAAELVHRDRRTGGE
jgi:putative peptidoglycan lipid II flippase